MSPLMASHCEFVTHHFMVNEQVRKHVLNVHKNHKAYQGWGEGGDCIPIATLSPPE